MEACVYAYNFGQILADQCLDRQSGVHRQLDRMRQVVFPFFRKRNPVQSRPQPVGGETVCAHIQLLDGQLLRGGSGFLNNRLYVPIGVADNPSKPARVGGNSGQHGHGTRVVLLSLHESCQGFGTQKRHIGVGDQHQVRFTEQAVFGLLDGMPGTQRRILEHTLGCIPQERAQGLPIHANHNHRLLGSDRAGHCESIIDHGFPADRVQHFQKPGFHACALTCGQEYGSDFHERFLHHLPHFFPRNGLRVNINKMSLRCQQSGTRPISGKKPRLQAGNSGWGAWIRTKIISSKG